MRHIPSYESLRMTLHAIALAAAALIAIPAAAETVKPAHVGEALKAGCSVQQVHTPAGKTVQSAPIIRCSPAAQQALAVNKANDAATAGASR